MSFNFKINPADYAGIDHEAYRSDMLQLALTQPTEYTKLRKELLNIVKKTAVNSQYAIYYYLLTVGQEAGTGDGGNSILKNAKLEEATKDMFVPHVPSQIVNEFALKASKTIDKIAEEAIEMILPADWKQIADNRTFSKTKSTLGFENA